MARFDPCDGNGRVRTEPWSPEDAGRVLSSRPRSSAVSGFTPIEALVVITLVSILVLFTAGFRGIQARRVRLTGAAREIRSLLWQARAEAISSGQPVVARFDGAANKVTVFRDYSANASFPHTGALATGDGNGVQDTYGTASDNEPTLHVYILPAPVVFRSPGGPPGDGNCIAFDGCVAKFGAAPVNDRVIFLPDGTSVAPTAANSQAPVALSDGTYTCVSCKGIYLADSAARDYFRISVDDSGLGGKVNVLKYLGTSGATGKYGPQPWQWN